MPRTPPSDLVSRVLPHRRALTPDTLIDHEPPIRSVVEAHFPLVPDDQASDARRDGNPPDQLSPTTIRASRPYIRPDLLYLGRGTFGQVRMFPLETTVFKSVLQPEHGQELYREFQLYSEARPAIGTPPEPGSFWIPRALQYWSPPTETASATLIPAGPSPPRTRQYLDSLIWSNFDCPTFQVDLIPRLNPSVATIYRNLFFGEELFTINPDVHMLRLYFGRTELPEFTNQLPPEIQKDFPLNIPRYQLLRAKIRELGADLPDESEVSHGMGVLLAKLHWSLGINGRDMELVLAGGDYGLQLWALDFNQVQRWLRPGVLAHSSESDIPDYLPAMTTGSFESNDLIQGCKRLARLISSQELYYPRPRQSAIYATFKAGYRSTVEALLSPFRIKHNGDIVCRAVILATDAFFEEFETLDKDKVQRQNVTRMRKYA